MHNGLVTGKEISPKLWDDFISSSPEGIIYATYDYISIVAPNWQAIILSAGNEVQVAFPLMVKRKMGYSYFFQPIFTQSWGVFFKTMDCKISKEYDVKKKLLKQILKLTEKLFSEASFNCTPWFNYSLPFYWEGYSIQNKYTYHIDTSKPIEEIWSGTSTGLRWHIKNAKKSKITINKVSKAVAIIDLFQKRKAEELKNLTASDFGRLNQIFDALQCKKRTYGLEAIDTNGNLLAGIIIYEFKDVTTYFLGTSKLEAKSSGAISLLLWEAIKIAAENGFRMFDFEGSMIESVERYFRGFGAKPVPYLSLSKTSKLIQLKNLVKV